MILQNMIASYGDLKRRPCDKCLKLIDKKLMFPIIRTQMSHTSPDGDVKSQWEAWHLDCV